ncbi:unnamed protein product [Vitrella brassicaformis CCMP3155]|uniref:ATP-dependent DNA helicase n=1 Tax=Vitrella brassicaformis (strain CCMP3155) TaxID=1169540 RepID=A0A0G4EW32_VITBC|nr:unnamed protein product [Vitrella brassicaformis CCMP3155]|eukprot:CEM02443.1 unnamed protein product [Vitrella brassicaformis CCMP3155]
MQDDFECDGVDVTEQAKGGFVLLPGSFVGSERYYKRLCQDAFAIVAQYGKPSWFIIITCNGNWPEIQEKLQSGQTAYDRPDLTSRVFHLKLRSLLQRLRDGPLSRALYLMAVIEYQKRGLSHAHISVRNEEHPSCGADVDKFVCGEMPRHNPQLRKLVESFMVHKCSARCRDEASLREYHRCRNANEPVAERCKYGFPQPLCDETHFDGRGRCVYRRRHEEDRWVPPYSPELLAEFNCHLYVDCAASTNVISYMYKYMYKPEKSAFLISVEHEKKRKQRAAKADAGEASESEQQKKRRRQQVASLLTNHQTAHPAQEQQRDEIRDYQQGRVLCASEACHRIFGHQIHWTQPSVTTLLVYLPAERPVVQRVSGRGETGRVFMPGLSMIDHWLNRPDATRRINNEDVDFDQMTYQQFFRRFAMKKDRARDPQEADMAGENADAHESATAREMRTKTGHGFYQRRRWEQHCTRLQSAFAMQGERYYLRLLLKGSQAKGSFEAIRTIDGTCYSTFSQAAKAAGLLEGQTYVENVMREAVEEQAVLPYQLRFLFVVLILNHECAAADILEKYREFMVDDYEEVDDPEAAYERLLREICEDLQECGMTNTECGPPEPQHIPAEEQTERKSYGSLTTIRQSYDRVHDMVEKVAEQKEVFEDIMAHIYPRNGDSPEPFCLLIKAPGGAGKTTVLRCVLSAVRSRGDIALASATTALAALNYVGGHTAHGLHKIPVVDDIMKENLRCTVSRTSQKADLLRKAKVIVWDEISMAHRKCIEAVDLMLQDIMECNLPFGGKVFVCAGDFRQLPLVLPRHEDCNETTIFHASLRSSDLYDEFIVRELKQIMRSKNDTAYTNMCLKVGDGRQRRFVQIHSQEDAIEFAFPDRLYERDPRACASRAILCPTNEAVDAINNTIIDRMDGQLCTHVARERYLEEDYQAGHHDEDFLAGQNESPKPPHTLQLKRGVVCLVLRNMSWRYGLSNNEKVIYKGPRGSSMIEVQKVGGGSSQ